MASNLVVIDASMRRTTVKVTPGTHLSDVLADACKKFGHSPDQHGLKHNNKPVDLSRTFRLSGLPGGAKLNLVQASRSPSVVSVALQLPSNGQGTGGRLMDKFPSNISIWQILRRFEAGKAGEALSNHNFTQRGTAQISNGASAGSGRLYYAMPVVTFPMGRELNKFVDLQKTLAQLGFNGGSCLVRLSFQNTEQPLEEAMVEISQYFAEAGPGQSAATSATTTSGTAIQEPDAIQRPDGIQEPDAVQQTDIQESNSELSTAVVTDTDPLETFQDEVTKAPTLLEAPEILQKDATSQLQVEPVSPPPGVGETSGLRVFAPPTSSTPAAAQQAAFEDTDYEPTVAHAQQHQARLAAETRNRRLKSDNELQAEEKARSDKLNAVTNVTVRLRFPDNSSANEVYGRQARVADLYELCRKMLDRPNDEAFSLRCPGANGTLQALLESDKRLITDLGWQYRMLVTVIWGPEVSRSGPSLKQEFLAQAEKLEVELPQPQHVAQDQASNASERANVQAPKPKATSSEKESKLKGFLRLGKK